VTFVSALRRAWADSQSVTHGSRILVVDDDSDVRDFYRAVIEDQFPSVLVTTAGDGLQALEIANAEVPDLVLLDLEMPHLEGVGFAQAFRSSPLLAKVPVVVISGHVGASRGGGYAHKFAAILSEFGATEQLAKPITPEQLADVVRRHVGGGRG
jgi:CheY-like chemotaxis protein